MLNLPSASNDVQNVLTSLIRDAVPSSTSASLNFNIYRKIVCSWTPAKLRIYSVSFLKATVLPGRTSIKILIDYQRLWMALKSVRYGCTTMCTAQHNVQW